MDLEVMCESYCCRWDILVVCFEKYENFVCILLEVFMFLFVDVS